MAILFPSLEKAKASKQKPTEGEVFLLEFLAANFDDQVEVYFQPCFNGDRPDIVLMSRKEGVVIIEVKDWNLDLYSIDENNKWSVNAGSRSQTIRSPFQQVFVYKKNFFDIHVNGLLEKSLKNKSFFGVIKTYVYFHHGSKEAIQRLYQPRLDRIRKESRDNEENYKSERLDFDAYEKKRIWLERGRHRFERDMALALHRDRLHKIDFASAGNKTLFDESVYNEFKRLLNPPYHYAWEGRPPNYSDKQRRLIQSEGKARSKICGLAGSGKTVVLAGRAVNAHKRHGGRILVLTFNITLRSYIHDKISAVREDFAWSFFDISNYHRFITSSLNNSGIEIEIPKGLQYEGRDPAVARRIAIERDRHFEEEYYSNLRVFEGADIKFKYDTILIDEIQDYKPEWIKIIRSYFLAEDGEMILFGDEKQNIYKRALDEERRSKVVEGFGKWVKLTKSFRYAVESPIIRLVESFQKKFLLQNYEIDPDESFQLSLTNVGVQAYGTFDRIKVDQLAGTIINIAKANKAHPNDISIISSQEGILRRLDHMLRTSETHKERTLCSFPSHEVTEHPKYSRNYDKISAAKKTGFNLNSGVMKLSSTHSFKGFESPLVFLLINNSDSPEMVFTGLTRAKENLMVFLEGDSPYLEFFGTHLSKLTDFHDDATEPSTH
ncbi:MULTISPECIES: nuclease-related domain-containing DEAD/DEAH box helicase [Paraburkholderia]|uniref:nuclease-related domain-containing DEAD/DEAH box helicase n=1 Tax=Paraburkholderia TaxID=1822464 RepID=UPI00225B33CE|nr:MULTISPECIES: UvrD-helicase domain-containing protein [Paraburkholderia]MCX4156646.1 UvrD-helicase domain-containing protein [Paraburkholderia aspalathi]MDN7166051.1 UvrD-helicase domain-containing protein [Paraburkholderia sp. SECH2]MDQ6394537.1 UvrD-helicase domain-containing protein [Paraburkholderia aspalathi]